MFRIKLQYVYPCDSDYNANQFCTLSQKDINLNKTINPHWVGHDVIKPLAFTEIMKHDHYIDNNVDEDVTKQAKATSGGDGAKSVTNKTSVFNEINEAEKKTDASSLSTKSGWEYLYEVISDH